MAYPSIKEKLNKKKLKREVGGIILLFLAIFFALSLASYSPSDPSLNHIISPTHSPAPPKEIENRGGIVGAYLADGTLQLLGLGSYLLPLALLGLSLILLLSSQLTQRLMKAINYLILITSSSVFLSSALSPAKFFKSSILPGGVLGDFSSRWLQKYFNPAGAYIICSLILLLSLMAITNLSVISLLRGITSILGGIARLLKTCWVGLKSLWEVSRRKSIVKKEKQKKPPVVVVQPEEFHLKEEAAPVTQKEKTRKPPATEQKFALPVREGQYHPPPLSLLNCNEEQSKGIDKDSLERNSSLLEKSLRDFGVEGKVIGIHPGPVITSYEFEPGPGVKVGRIANLSDDLSLTLKALSIRILTPIPGKGAVGIEIPNPVRETVYLKEILSSPQFQEGRAKLLLALGKDSEGSPVVTDLAKMPHLLVAGATGSGKSVSLNAMILSILYKRSPEEVRLLLVDPKMLELSSYDGIPHLLHEVVTDAKAAAQSLRWAVAEMERRYKLMVDYEVRSIEHYNLRIEKELKKGPEDHWEFQDSPTGEGSAPKKLPYLVIIIDELADLMLISSRQVEECITRLAQMARAAGIHLVVATQRPSVDVLTGIIKANFSARISFQVSSRVDSRTILDTNGAETLLGDGDMLFLPPGVAKLQRIHGSLVTDSEIKGVVEFLAKQGSSGYYPPILKEDEDKLGEIEYDEDERYDEAVAMVTETKQASISMIQRRLRVGYNRAARMVERMEQEGIVGPSDGVKPREVLKKVESEGRQR